MLSDWLGLRKPVLIGCALGLAAMIPLMLLFTGPLLVIVMVFAGLFFGPLIPIAVTIPVELPEVSVRHAGTAAGLLFMGGNLGATFGPIGIGAVIDITGTPWGGIVVATSALLITMLPLMLVRETGSRANPQAVSTGAAAGH